MSPREWNTDDRYLGATLFCHHHHWTIMDLCPAVNWYIVCTVTTPDFVFQRRVRCILKKIKILPKTRWESTHAVSAVRRTAETKKIPMGAASTRLFSSSFSVCISCHARGSSLTSACTFLGLALHVVGSGDSNPFSSPLKETSKTSSVLISSSNGSICMKHKAGIQNWPKEARESHIQRKGSIQSAWNTKRY